MILKTPIEFQGRTYSELKFSEPTGIVIAECGAPIKSSGLELDKAGKIDAQAVTNLMIRCAGVPAEVIHMLKPKDWLEAMGEILLFFADTDAKQA